MPEGYRGLVEAVRKGVQDAIKATIGATNAARIVQGDQFVDAASLRRVTSWLSQTCVMDDALFEIEGFW